MKPVFITGNQKKAEYLAKWLGIELEHRSVDQDEIQSLDLETVVEHKARQAYKLVGGPVLVEDVSLTFTAMGHLPGTFVKWFIQEIGLEGLCALAQSLPRQDAEAAILYGLFDGTSMHYFEARQKGSISPEPRGDAGFGWNPIFIPDGTDLTYGEMDEPTFATWNIRAHAVAKIRDFLEKSA